MYIMLDSEIHYITIWGSHICEYQDQGPLGCNTRADWYEHFRRICYLCVIFREKNISSAVIEDKSDLFHLCNHVIWNSFYEHFQLLSELFHTLQGAEASKMKHLQYTERNIQNCMFKVAISKTEQERYFFAIIFHKNMLKCDYYYYSVFCLTTGPKPPLSNGSILSCP